MIIINQVPKEPNKIECPKCKHLFVPEEEEMICPYTAGIFLFGIALCIFSIIVSIGLDMIGFSVPQDIVSLVAGSTILVWVCALVISFVIEIFKAKNGE